MTPLAELNLEVREGVPVAGISGEVDMSNAAELTLALQEAVDQQPPGLVLDLTATNYLDSAGLHFLFDIGKRLRDRGQRLVLVVPETSALNRLFELVKIDALAPVERDVGVAVTSVREAP